LLRVIRSINNVDLRARPFPRGARWDFFTFLRRGTCASRTHRLKPMPTTCWPSVGV